ncbi:ThuA domain-containing protein [Flavihumibacter petaseus]|uniref:DUF218 domain-containing protein n=1 Tax=Flavihumibacter petaseus NBRC 106054 TaxID=1220578 RepID=A0A0E9N062_9BACT|nr:ThuA domain-containing protein [Flavihumibacter petaseus]GAO43239.1 hypothetical protein FPE01S_02_03430 [Flavihumibacter petaseus NBRC 106054]
MSICKLTTYLLLLTGLFTGCSYSSKTSRRLLQEARNNGPFDVAVAPGVPLENGSWSRTMKGRIYWAKYLYDQGIVKNIMFSGGAVYTPYTEAVVMREYAIALGIPATHIFTEAKAEHSTENIYYGYRLAKTLGFNRIALASDPFQTKLLTRYVRKKVEPTVSIIPFVTDKLAALEPDMKDPVIDFTGKQVAGFTPINKRENFWKRWRGTRGKNIDTSAYSLLPDAANMAKNLKVVAFFTGNHDQAHISFVREANQYLARMAGLYHFQYDTTSNWNNLNLEYLSEYKVVLFLDTRPETSEQRAAFQQYMESGGAWMGFHFAGFALTPSAYPQNWDWYHNTFLGAGSYKGNTWRPTSAILQKSGNVLPVSAGLPDQFKTSPNEWYSWERDLTRDSAIRILYAIDSTSFPLGTGPKPHEIWHDGYYPVIWANKHYRMVYFNMGHNDIDYEHHTNQELSATFDNPEQNRVLMKILFSLSR